MILWFRQRFFSWFDSYDIYDEAGKTVYVVKGQFSWGHCLKIFDSSGKEVGTVKERVLALMPKFEMYIGDKYVGCIRKKLTFFKSEYTVDCNGWFVKSNFMEWDYKIFNANGQQIATVSKQLFRLTDTLYRHAKSAGRSFCLNARACNRCRKVQPRRLLRKLV